MISFTTVVDALMSEVGWRQNYDPTGEQLQDLTTSASGLYYQDAHPLLTLDNLQSICPNFSAIAYSAYDSGAAYTTGNVVTLGGQKYKAVAASTGVEPGTDATRWAVYYPFTEWLKEKTRSSLQRLLARIFEEKIIEKSARSLFQQVNLFEGAGSISDTIASSGKVAGLELNFFDGIGFSLRIDRVGVQFSGSGTFNLYLMHSSKKTPVATKEIVYTGEGSVEWFDTDWSLDNVSIDPSGAYFVVYNQSEAPGDAVNRAIDWRQPPCFECGRSEMLAYNTWSKYVEVHPFEIEGSANAMLDNRHNAYQYTRTYGLNLSLTAMCDMTRFFVLNKSYFVSAMMLQVASDMLREIAYNANARINRAESVVKRGEIIYELDGAMEGKPSGINYELQRAIKAIKIDTEGFDPACLPCQKSGVKYRGI